MMCTKNYCYLHFKSVPYSQFNISCSFFSESMEVRFTLKTVRSIDPVPTIQTEPNKTSPNKQLDISHIILNSFTDPALAKNIDLTTLDLFSSPTKYTQVKTSCITAHFI